VASQSNDPDFLAIMEHMDEPIQGDSDEEDASGEEAPEEDDDDNEEEFYKFLKLKTTNFKIFKYKEQYSLDAANPFLR
jgi:hypothetical protein